MQAQRAWNGQDLDTRVARFLARSGLAGPYLFSSLPTGGNNRVFRLEAGGRVLVLKLYFRHPGDRRDRLAAEYDFLSFVRNLGLEAAPLPIARDPDLGMGLYTYIPGRKPIPGEPSFAFVRQALDFLTGLNAGKNYPQARLLAPASEACFSLAEHLALIDGRIQRLGGIKVLDEADEDAARFQCRTLAPRWREVRESLSRRAAALGLAPEVPLPPADRVLSPSDFGFHNALVKKNGRLAFIDFEYAGWDDPAKTVCDFFCQPELPVSAEYLPAVLERLSATVEDGPGFQARVKLLLPAYRIKWSCITLNEFLPIGRERRRHANRWAADPHRKPRQLAKAQAFVENLAL